MICLRSKLTSEAAASKRRRRVAEATQRLPAEALLATERSAADLKGFESWGLGIRL